MASSLTITGLANYFEPVGGPADSAPFSTVLIKDPLHTHDHVLVSVTLGTVSTDVPTDTSLSGLLFSSAGAFDESLSFYQPPVFTSTLDTITFADFTTGTVLGSETITLCFLRGTRILTPVGEVPIETLSPGDRVTTLSGAHRALRWIGTGRALITQSNRDRASPVVVRRNAITEGVPRRDLYLTRGHSLFIDGVLIPVEELVNHRSVAWVEQPGVVEYYHLEVDGHDVILAEGAPAETYRDDGNSAQFQNITDRPATEPVPPCVPIVSAGPVLHRIWDRISRRARLASLPQTDDPDLHLLADGVRLDGEKIGDRIWRFQLNSPISELRILSRSAVPSAIGTVRDHRRLGVALRRVVIEHVGVRTEIGWDAPCLEKGFSSPEPLDCHRWTNGDASLPPALLAMCDAGTTVELHVNCLLSYPVPTIARAA